MLRIAQPMKDAAAVKKYYSREHNPSDYYFLDQDKGIWTGKLAERLGLSGEVQQHHFDRMCDHLHPLKDKPLTARKNLDRRISTDISFSCTKSVSMLALMTKDERIFQLLRDAATETLALMEQNAGTRVRRCNQERTVKTGEWAAAMFVHTTSRPAKEGQPPDCQLHLHAAVLNCTASDENPNKRKALDLTYVYKDLPFYQQVFHSIVARGIEQMGYAIERRGVKRVNYEIASITRDMIWKFSGRTKQILAEIKRLGITDPKVMDKMAENTRLPKGESQWSDKALMQSWWDKLTPEEELRIKKADQWGRVQAVSPEQAMDMAIEHWFAKQSVVQDKRLLEYAMRCGIGSVTLEQVQEELASREWIGFKNKHDQQMLTTPAMAGIEGRILSRAHEGRGKCDPLGKLQKDGKTKDGITLDEYQYQAANQLLKNTDRISLLIGKAGVGKTTVMKAIREGIEANKQKVIAIAPSAEASRGVQRAEGFKDATTVADFLDKPDLQWKARGQVIWCDEASMLGVKEMDTLMKTAHKLKARLILSGDTGQHRAVDAGDALRLLVDHGRVRPVRLSQIRRQQNAIYRKAVEFISRGKVHSAWDQLEKMGAIVEHEDERRRHHELAHEYIQALRNGETVMAIAPTHSEGKKVTEHIRTHLKVQGIVSGAERKVKFHRNLHLSTADKKQAAAYERTQKIFFHKACPGIQAGSRFKVLGVYQNTVYVNREGAIGMQGLPLKYASRFSMYQPEDIPVAKGDILKVTQNTKTLDGQTRINNGTMLRCVGFDGAGNMKVQPWASGKPGKKKPRTMKIAKGNGHLNHGVCVTSHASQAKTIDVILGALGMESLAAINLKQFYVTISRGRKRCKVFCEDAGYVKHAIGGTDDRMLATELMKSRSLKERIEQARWLQRFKDLPAWSGKKRETSKPTYKKRRSRGLKRPAFKWKGLSNER